VRDAELVEDIKVAHKANLGVYGARKIHAELNREGVKVARCTVERLMRAEGLRGIPREKTRKTTIGDGAETERPEDLVKRKFVATAPNHQRTVEPALCVGPATRSGLRCSHLVGHRIFGGEVVSGHADPAGPFAASAHLIEL
jgi:transposase InsO family protein